MKEAMHMGTKQVEICLTLPARYLHDRLSNKELPGGFYHSLCAPLRVSYIDTHRLSVMTHSSGLKLVCDTHALVGVV